MITNVVMKKTIKYLTDRLVSSNGLAHGCGLKVPRLRSHDGRVGSALASRSKGREFESRWFQI